MLMGAERHLLDCLSSADGEPRQTEGLVRGLRSGQRIWRCTADEVGADLQLADGSDRRKVHLLVGRIRKLIGERAGLWK